MEFKIDKLEFTGELARLIPVGAESNKERKITSVVVAALTAVDEYGKGILSAAGAPVRKTSVISAFTEVVFKGSKLDKKSRPDALLVLKTGNKFWTALVEAKIGNAVLDEAQVEEYLDLAKKYKIDAVITISNQFSTLPTHHPVKVSKTKLKNVGLYHWSWQFLVAEAILWEKYKGIVDPDQAYLLKELTRFLQHDSTGVMAVTKMHADWKEVCQLVQNNVPLLKTSAEVNHAMSSWYELCRDLSLTMSIAVGENVGIQIPKKFRDDAALRLSQDCTDFCATKVMMAEFNVPAASAPIKLVADFEKKSLLACMTLGVPLDKATTKGKINWLLRQLDKCADEQMLVKVIWSNRSINTVATLACIRTEGAEALLQENSNLSPVSFELMRHCDLGAKFKGQRTFVDAANDILPQFYKHVGQHLTAWQPPAPAVKTDKPKEVLEGIEASAEKQKIPA